MRKISKYAACILLVIVLLSFNKRSSDFPEFNKTNPASSYTPDVLDKWMEVQIKLMSTTVAQFNGPFVRIYSYSGLAAYEAIVPGIPKKSKYLIDESVLSNFPVMPQTEADKNYYWPASVNAALAFMNRAMFPTTSPANKASIDSLEKLLRIDFLKETDAVTVERSAAYGQAVAEKIYEWAETDGYRRANDPYTAPIGPGKWVPTAPNYVKAVTPYWGRLRKMVINSNENTEPPPPPSYSEDSSSDFYRINKEIYDVDRQLTPEQKDLVYFWRDINPGVTAPGHWLNILRQVLHNEKKNAMLDKATYAYALTGLSLNDAWICCWKTRYEYNLLRPVTYIRQVMGYREWLPLLMTPPHPEYTSGFAAMAGSVSEALTIVFGDNYKITDHTYDQFGMKPRSFASFYEMANEAGNSKFYGGIHYKLSVDAGLQQGQKVAKNIANTLAHQRIAAKP